MSLAPRPLEEACTVAPCDVCEAMTPATTAHTHHHEPGCGIDHPAREWCRCDPWRCPACCPCDIPGMTEVRSA